MSSSRRATIEDVTDSENVRKMESLPPECPSLLMTEEEFLSLPKGEGETKTKPGSKTRKPETEKKPAPVTDTQAQEFEMYYGSQFCEPTSSEIKIEDLVTDEDEKEMISELEREALKQWESDNPPQKRTFWDRPIPPPQFEWMPDPRMPKEWNEVVASMRTDEWARYKTHTSESSYRQANQEEISHTQEFTQAWYPDSKQREFLRAQSVLRLNTGDTSELSLKKMRERFERPKITENKVNYQPNTTKRVDKGKGKETSLTEEDFPRLRQQWHDEFYDMVQGVKEVLPPFREVNHEIHTIDENKRYTYHMPCCPSALRDEFYQKLNRYIDAGWWEARASSQAAPLMCIPKKDGHIRTVVDARQRNDNTVKDVTPLPDQEVIREDVARGRYRSKIDLADAYEQVRVRLEDVYKTAFSTIAGTYVSNVVQQGDCNAPATFQRLMTSIFRDAIGRFMHVYLDDIFIYSDSIEEHETHLRYIFEKLRESQLFLKWKKCELYADKVDCLGHVIDDKGIHPDSDKLSRIREWRIPRNYNDIQKFVGLVNYVGNFLPNISAYTGPLLAMTMNGAPFHWRPLHQKCFDMIKRICCKTPIIRPIDPKLGEPLWLICDASKTGIGAMYGQGPTWQKCRPAGFMSKKFTNAQQNYAVHELETLAILEALLKWEDKLVGYRLHVITDHKALEFFKTQVSLSHRQRRWTDYMSRFDFDITYIKGEYNKAADCLSRYYESDTSADIYEPHEYVQADARIDPEGEDLPAERFKEIKEHVVEIRAMRAAEVRRSRRLMDRREDRDDEALRMEETNHPEDVDEISHRGDDPSLGEYMFSRKNEPAPKAFKDDAFLDIVKKGYSEDKLFSRILENADDFPAFEIQDGVIWWKNPKGDRVSCIPRDRELITTVITQAHEVVGHFGDQRTAEYIRRWYWWPQIVKDVREFCHTCDPCQRCKPSNSRPHGKLHMLPVPTKPWDSIGMDFVGPFPESRGFNYLWVIICRMTSMVHLIPVHTKMTASELSWIYLREIVRLHGLPSSIVSDRDSKFTSKWWRELHKVLGARLLMSTSFHPQTDGQTERANRNVGQIFRTLVRPDQKDWVGKVDMTEFAINASVSETTRYAPFELNGGYMPSMIREIRNSDIVVKGIRSFAADALQNLAAAHDAIIEARVIQTHTANKKRMDEPTYAPRDLVYLSTKNLNMPKNRARKLCPKYIGPYRVLAAYKEKSTYTLELPLALQSRRITPTFHASLLRPYHASSDALFPNRVQPDPYDFGAADEQEWFVDELLGHRWIEGGGLEYEVRWSLGDTTWEPHAECKKLEALDRYLELQGVKRPSQLPKRSRQ